MIPSRGSRGIDESHTTVGAKGEARFPLSLPSPPSRRNSLRLTMSYAMCLAITTNWKLRYRRCASGCCHSCVRRTPRSLRHLN